LPIPLTAREQNKQQSHDEVSRDQKDSRAVAIKEPGHALNRTFGVSAYRRSGEEVRDIRGQGLNRRVSLIRIRMHGFCTDRENR